MSFQHISKTHPCVKAVRCHHCGANPGEACHASSGREAEPHRARLRAYDRHDKVHDSQPEVAE